MSLSFADLTHNPFAEAWFADSHGRMRLIRPLRPRDGERFSRFLSSLSSDTRRFLAPHEVARFAHYGIEYDPALCASLAPVVAEGWQSQGLGAPLLKQGVHLCRELGRQAVVLMGGVQDANRRAVHFYLRHGFHRLDSFEWPHGVLNDDMIRWL